MWLRNFLLTVAASYAGLAQVSIVPHNPNKPAATSTTGNHWSLSGATVRRAVGEIYDVTPARVDFPAGLDDEKVYDFAVEMPPEGGQMTELLRAAFEQQFGVTIRRENRLMDIYVLTAPNGPGKLVPAPPSEGHSVRMLNGHLTAHCMGMPMFAQFLESPLVLGRPVVDETRLSGEYDIEGKMVGAGATQTLRELGLSVTPDKRTIEVIVVRSSR